MFKEPKRRGSASVTHRRSDEVRAPEWFKRGPGTGLTPTPKIDKDLRDRQDALTLDALTKGLGARMPDAQLHEAMSFLNSLLQAGRLQDVRDAYRSMRGQDALNALLDLFSPWLDTKRDLAEALGTQIPDLTRAAFAEQLAVSAAYANGDDLSDSKMASSKNVMGKLLRVLGYTAGPLIVGRWGYQARVFKPDGVKAKWDDTFFVHRGTETIRPPWLYPRDPMTREGQLDTYIGDFARSGTGEGQFFPNEELIVRNARAAGGQVTSIGHSLGGALAQILACTHPSLVKSVLTFASPAVSNHLIGQLHKGLKGRDLHSEHYRTTNDLVPQAGEQLSDGKVFTFERFERFVGEDSWRSGNDPATVKNHNNLPLRGMLSFRKGERLSGMQQAILNFGAQDPAVDREREAARQEGRPTRSLDAISVLHNVSDTVHDPLMHAELGRTALVARVMQPKTLQVFVANLGYELLVEWFEARLKAMPPSRYPNRKALLSDLHRVRDEIDALGPQPLTPNALDLAQRLGLNPLEVLAIKALGPIKAPQRDVETVKGELLTFYLSWFPEAEGLK